MWVLEWGLEMEEIEGCCYWVEYTENQLIDLNYKWTNFIRHRLLKKLLLQLPFLIIFCVVASEVAILFGGILLGVMLILWCSLKYLVAHQEAMPKLYITLTSKSIFFARQGTMYQLEWVNLRSISENKFCFNISIHEHLTFFIKKEQLETKDRMFLHQICKNLEKGNR